MKNIKKMIVGVSTVSMIGLIGCSSTDNMTKSEISKVNGSAEVLALQLSHDEKTDTYSRSKYQQELERINNENEQLGEEIDTYKSEIDKCINDLKFEKYDEKSNVKYYKCDATNTTYKDYAFVDLKAELLDDNGESIDMITILVDGGWKAGETKELTFMTNKNFSSIKYHHEEY